MYNQIARATMMALFCFILSGCAVGIKSTNLKAVPALPEDTRLLNPVGYVFHDEVNKARRGKLTESQSKLIESEKMSWIEALSGFTGKDNIFVMSEGRPVNILDPSLLSAKTSPTAQPDPADQNSIPLAQDINTANMMPGNTPNNVSPDSNKTDAFTEFAKTHPIVHVYVKSAPEAKGEAMDNMVYGTFWMTFLSFGITPAYLPIPYTASFTLSMPNGQQGPPVHWDYTYDRQVFYWLPLLIPMEDYLTSLNTEDEMDIRWKVEEKRRLVLMFLHDAKPVLQGQ